METIMSIFKLIALDTYFIKTKLKDTYYTIPISQQHLGVTIAQHIWTIALM